MQNNLFSLSLHCEVYEFFIKALKEEKEKEEVTLQGASGPRHALKAGLWDEQVTLSSLVTSDDLA